MAPPKVRMHQKPGAGKLKTLPKPNPTPSTSTPQENAPESFEIELAWCIQRLEESLNSGKLNQKATDDTMKTIKILRSGNQPIIRKRQLMRTTFGDYRAKMLEDERNFSLDPRNIKFERTNVGKSSSFVKKSAFLQAGGKDFKFNFDVEEKIKEAQQEEPKKPINTDFKPSDNSFRFNFSISTENENDS